MSRILKRPMFKMGGSPTGIATLTPRVNAKIGFPGFEFLEPGLQQEIRSQMKPPTSGATTFSGKGLTRGSTGTRLGLKFLRNFAKISFINLIKTEINKEILRFSIPLMFVSAIDGVDDCKLSIKIRSHTYIIRHPL